jgi:hypothetical protein
LTPSIDERLASVIRALTDVVLPSLPKDSGLAIEQLQLSVGHLQILRNQLDLAPAYEKEEFTDASALGAELVMQSSGGPNTVNARTVLQHAIDQGRQSPDTRESRTAINSSVAGLIEAIAADGSDTTKDACWSIVLEHERNRVAKDRRWFACFGFDNIDDLGK